MIDGGRTASGAERQPRVLVLRPDHLGDLLLTLPAISALRRRLPDAQIVAMVAPELLAIAQRAVDLDEALVMPLVMRDPPPRADSPIVQSTAEALAGRFDLALLPRPSDPWSGALAAAAGVPLRVGHAQPATIPFLTHAFLERPSRHVAREAVILALRAARLLGYQRHSAAAPPRLPLRLLAEDRRAAARLLLGIGTGSSVVVVHPVAGWQLKTWPLEHWRVVARSIADRLETSVLVVGQQRDRPLLDAIANGAGRNVHAVDNLSIGALAALHSRARIVVGIDSGALHLAALSGARVVALFGPFAPPRAAPLAVDGRLLPLWRSLPCSPCGTLEQPPCGAIREPACLRAIPAQEVVDAAIELDRRNLSA